MNRLLLTTLITTAIASTAVLAEEAAPNSNAEEAKGIVKAFATRLLGELQTAIKEGGPVKAISVCKDRAPAIAKDLSQESGWEVSRVSLKARNATLGVPDAWEKAVLERFETRKAAGEEVGPMAHAEVVASATDTRFDLMKAMPTFKPGVSLQGAEADTQFRFMKAIPTQETCLICHGTEITAEVAAALDEHYPNDQARGFALGDIRGAFSLSKSL